MHLGCFCKKNYCQELLKNRPIWSHWVTGGERRSQYICKRNYSLTLAVVVTFVVVVVAAVVAVVFVVLYNVVTLPNLKLLQSHYFVVCSAFSFVIRDFKRKVFFKKSASTGLFFVYFWSFSNKHECNFYKKLMWKNVHPEYLNSDLQNMSPSHSHY